MRSAIITPFNVFSAFSFVLLVAVAALVNSTSIPRVGLAAASAFLGFLLIATFLVWTLFEGD
jgi:hypothetical protein